MNAPVTNSSAGLPPAVAPLVSDDGVPLRELADRVMSRWKLVLGTTVLAGAGAYGVATLLPPMYSAQAVFLTPQSAKSSTTAALSALSSLGALPGGAAPSTPADQYVALMQSRSAFDRIIDGFKLIDVYGVPLRSDAREKLRTRTSFSLGKRDGLITVGVEDRDPKRAADMANAFVEVLREMTSTLAITEAQQRRKFFEGHLEATSTRLKAAQERLQGSGYSQGALQSEPKAAAEAYARLRAEITATEVRLQVLRTKFTDGAPELQQVASALTGLRRQLAAAEAAPPQAPAGAGADYVGRFRDFKYQEALYELYARQFEAARVDESREGMLIQIVDVANPPERKSFPRRGLITLAVAGCAFLATLLLAVLLGPQRRRDARP